MPVGRRAFSGYWNAKPPLHGANVANVKTDPGGMNTENLKVDPSVRPPNPLTGQSKPVPGPATKPAPTYQEEKPKSTGITAWVLVAIAAAAALALR